ncbi:MATE family efflux transporter [Paraferrimonas sp. SM1919]|uniref:MATE family efflux transporter n=1 Tax=Paraferrimonas sp. SM1919 TaxID=2662263 RepID=UPI0013D05E0A|nr:MATE family efflux transporter [Paraferrimonas sp. SM1919]
MITSIIISINYCSVRLVKSKPAIGQKSLFSLTLPIFIDLTFIFLISATDAWFLSQIDDQAAAAVGAMMPILGIAFALYSTLHQAGCSIASQRLGANDFKNLATSYGILLLLFVCVGLIMLSFFVLETDYLVGLMGLQQPMFAMATSYMHILGYGTFFLAMRYCAAAILASQGMTKWNMYSTALMSIVNIALNYLLVDGKLGFPALGIDGVALASVCAWLSSCIFSYVVIWKQKNIHITFANSVKQALAAAKPITKLALPSVLEPLSWQISQLFITMIIVSFGAIELATRIYTFNLIYLTILFGFAMSAGVQIKVAYYIGANEYEQAQKILFTGVRYGLIGVFSFMLIVVSFAEFFYHLFTYDEAIIALGKKVLMVSLVTEFGRSLNLIVGASLRACGDAKFTSIVGFSSMWGVALTLSYLLGVSLGLGLIGVALAMCIDEVLRGSINIFRWRTGKWQTKGLYQQSRKKHH